VVNIVHPLLDDVDWPERRDAAQAMLDRLVAVAQSDGTIGADVTVVDVVHSTIRFSRPLGIGIGLAEERAIAHRQLDTFIDGLSGSRSST